MMMKQKSENVDVQKYLNYKEDTMILVVQLPQMHLMTGVLLFNLIKAVVRCMI